MLNIVCRILFPLRFSLNVSNITATWTKADKEIPPKPANIWLFGCNWPNNPGLDLALISSGGNATSRMKPAGDHNLPSQPKISCFYSSRTWMSWSLHDLKRIWNVKFNNAAFTTRGVKRGMKRVLLVITHLPLMLRSFSKKLSQTWWLKCRDYQR